MLLKISISARITKDGRIILQKASVAHNLFVGVLKDNRLN